jgi:hypothetical protein
MKLTSGVKLRNRRKNALIRLEQQLESGVKSVKFEKQPLTESDIKRINKEILILKSKI